MDYEGLIKKFESKTRIEKPAKYKVPEERLDVNNPDYDAKIKQLFDIHNRVNKITQDENEAPLLLLDNMRLAVLAKDFAKVENREESYTEAALNYAGFRAWCGRGTKLMANVAADQDFANSYAIDMICKNHDFNTFRAKTQQDILEADIQMLKEVQDNYLINNLFGTKQKMDAASGIINHIIKSVFSFDTAMNIMKVGQLKGLVEDIVKTPAQYRQTKQASEEMQYYKQQSEQGINLPRYRRHIREQAEIKNQEYEQVKSKAKWLGLGIGQKALFTSIFKDTLLAGLATGGILLKMVYENILRPDIKEMIGLDIGTLTAPVITEYNPEDIADLVKQFQDIQNERLEKAGYEPIDIINMTPETPIQQTPIPGVPVPESEPEPEPIKDINEDIYDITDIPFGLETETLNELNKYIENLE
jgi:hypothetical protein